MQPLPDALASLVTDLESGREASMALRNRCRELLAERWPIDAVHERPEAILSTLEPAMASSAGGDEPPGLIGRRCPLPSLEWHARALNALLERGHGSSATQQARLLYHLRWILHLLEPQQPRWIPGVSVIIPVYNRAELVGEAIESALAQTYPRVEIIVVDDGSEDAIEAAIAPFRSRIRFLQQTNQGVAKARNHALSLARGDYVHFLDSDNLLSPDYLLKSTAAFLHFADAEIAYAPPLSTTEKPKYIFGSGIRIYSPFLLPLHGGEDCASANLMSVVAHRHPFLMLGALLPRWLLLECGGFDERLRRGEDSRLWFRLGMRDTKVVGLADAFNQRRKLPSGLHSTSTTADVVTFSLINLVDLLGRPERWPHIPKLLQRFSDPALWSPLEQDEPVPLIAEYRTTLLQRLCSLPEQTSPYSPTPVLLAFHQLACAAHERFAATDSRALFARRLRLLCTLLLRRSPAPTDADLTLWLPTLPASHASPLCLLTLSLMERGHWWHGSSPPETFWQDLDQAIAALPASPGINPAAAYRDGLWRACHDDRASLARVAHEAAWLLALLSGQPGPLVSIVIPVCDAPEPVADTIASCMDQRYGRLEVLVIDDGANQDLLDALRPWLARLRLLRQPKQGPAAARQLAVQAARGPLLLLLEPGERLDPEAIETALASVRPGHAAMDESEGSAPAPAGCRRTLPISCRLVT